MNNLSKDNNVKTFTNKRNDFIDVLKGICIFLVLWGHCIQYLSNPSISDFFNNAVFKFIYSFHMPLFMLISGYLFYFSLQKYSPAELFEKKFFTLLRPIITGSILLFFFTAGIRELLSADFKLLIGGKYFSSLMNFWFLWSLIACSCAVCILQRFLTFNITTFGIFLLFGSLITMLFPYWVHNLYMYPYFILGILSCKYKEKLFQYSRFSWIAIVIFAIMLFFFDRKYYIYTSGLYGKLYSVYQYLFIDMYRWLIGLVGSISFITIVERLYSLHKKRIERERNSLALLGKYTLQMYVLQAIFLEAYIPVGIRFVQKSPLFTKMYTVWSGNDFLFAFCVALPVACVYAIALYKIIRWLEKKNISQFLFGR